MGKVFLNRDQLLNHVSRCIPRTFVHRFHLRCGIVLENNPKLSLEQFIKRARESFSVEKRQFVKDSELEAYYNQFRPIYNKQYFCKEAKQNAVSNREPGIISNGNPYYFDQLVTVRKF